jgi:hypothetical protein
MTSSPEPNGQGETSFARLRFRVALRGLVVDHDSGVNDTRRLPSRSNLVALMRLPHVVERVLWKIHAERANGRVCRHGALFPGEPLRKLCNRVFDR